jgi:hypothetical protein
MIKYSHKHRSGFCHLITDFHSEHQKRVARFDFLGVVTSGFMAALMVGLVRLLVSN